MIRPNRSKRIGFTLIELLVVIAVISLLAALLLSAIVKSREAARAVVCESHLREIGAGLEMIAVRTPSGQLCSGLFDHSREGCMDTYGWVADLANVGISTSSTLLCPSSPMQVNQKLLDAYGLPTNDDLNDLTGSLRDRYEDGMCGKTQWNGLSGSGDPDEGFASTDPLTDERVELLSRYFIQQGYNTNYATSWFLTYTAPRVKYDPSFDEIRTNGQAAQQGLRGRRETIGPLTQSYLGRSDIPSSNIPLVGDAAPGDIDEAISPVTFGFDETGVFARDNERRTFAENGQILCESVSEGPMFYHRSQKKMKRIGSNGSRLRDQWECDLSNQSCEPPTGSSGNQLYLQSSLAWAAMHRGRLNLLFADGSVRSFVDLNEDLFLNPGFPIPEGLSEDAYDQFGYQDNTVELPRHQVFSGVFIAPSTLKGIFE